MTRAPEDAGLNCKAIGLESTLKEACLFVLFTLVVREVEVGAFLECDRDIGEMGSAPDIIGIQEGDRRDIWG